MKCVQSKIRGAHRRGYLPGVSREEAATEQLFDAIGEIAQLRQRVCDDAISADPLRGGACEEAIEEVARSQLHVAGLECPAGLQPMHGAHVRGIGGLARGVTPWFVE